MRTRKGCTVNAKDFFGANLANQFLIEKTAVYATVSDLCIDFFNRFSLIFSGLALSLLLTACSTAPQAPHGASAYSNAQTSSRVSSEQASDITIYAVGLVGTPYRYGGNTPDAGFDCSGLIGHVYQSRAEVAPPRTVLRLQSWGQAVANDSVRSGDLVLFAQSDVATHAGIYVGDGRFVHAPSSGGEVRLDRLNSKYWSTQRVSFRRP